MIDNRARALTTTLCLKKVPTFKLSVTLPMKFATKPCDSAHLALGMLLHFYFVKLKTQISADIQPIWKKMQTYCILIASNFVIPP